MRFKYFTSDEDWQFDSRIHRLDNEWLFYGEGYREACELIEKQILTIDRTNQDSLIYPYCYLLRHYVEIRFKEIISEGCKMLAVPNDPKKGGHDLMQLFKRAEEILELVWKEQFEKAPQNVDDFIRELHAIDVKSDSFRYPIDKTGNPNLPDINRINLKKLAAIFEEVKYYLDGASDGLAARKDNFGAY